jgi:hypothetical protein
MYTANIVIGTLFGVLAAFAIVRTRRRTRIVLIWWAVALCATAIMVLSYEGIFRIYDRYQHDLTLAARVGADYDSVMEDRGHNNFAMAYIYTLSQKERLTRDQVRSIAANLDAKYACTSDSELLGDKFLFFAADYDSARWSRYILNVEYRRLDGTAAYVFAPDDSGDTFRIQDCTREIDLTAYRAP